MEDLIHRAMSFLAPPIAITSLLLVLPPYLISKLVSSVLSSIFSEDVAGKVVLIAGASSGIGEHLAYEYSRRGAYLALAARRKNSLREVADRALQLGSQDVIAIPTDVSIVEDCERLIRQTVDHFGRLDHLVNVAGITPVSLFEELTDVTKFAPTMDINFWGSVYMTHFAVPHLRRSRGKIIGIASSTSWLRVPRLSDASKAAVASFYETLRVELDRDVGITIVTPGLIESEMTKGKFLTKDGHMEVHQDLRDVVMSIVPVERVGRCTKAIVDGACRGDHYITKPGWMRTTYFWKVLCPEVMDWSNRFFLMLRPGSPNEALSKKLLDLTGLKKYVYPESILSPEIKMD